MPVRVFPDIFYDERRDKISTDRRLFGKGSGVFAESGPG
jgi:hypothetical protein